MYDISAMVTEEYVDNAVRAVKQDMKVWLMGTALSSAFTLALPMVGVVFYLGNISSKLDAAFATQDEHQTVLAERRTWMDRRERNEENLTAWARTQGYAPPERVP